MKKSILLSLALLASIGLSAAPTTEGDTIVVEKPQRVTVVTTDSIQHILVEGKEDNPHYTYSNTLQIVAQKDTDPTVASLILCLESVFAVLAGALVLHQIPTGRELAGCVLMFAAIVLAQRE